MSCKQRCQAHAPAVSAANEMDIDDTTAVCCMENLKENQCNSNLGAIFAHSDSSDEEFLGFK